MLLGEDLRNLKIVVRDRESGDTIADTIVKYYDKQFDIIRIESETINENTYPHVNILIFATKSMYKCSGTVRGNGNTGEIDIALYNSVEEDDRKATRYLLSMPGMLISLIRPGEEMTLVESFPITVLNMSTTGFLFRAPDGILQKNDIVKLSCLFKGRRLVLQGEIIRAQNRDIQNIEYGCKLFSVQNKQS